MEKNKTQQKTEEKKVSIRVAEDFLDKNDTSVRYERGSVVVFDAERAADVLARGLAEYVEPETPQG